MKRILFLFVIFCIIIFVYFFDDSYRYSLEAKTYYEFGKYQEAYNLAKKAYKLNRYNRMAFTILTQSQLSQVWEKYIKNSKEYFTQIESISNKDIISNADRIRIKMMLEIIIGEYGHLPDSKLLHKSLKEGAKKQYLKAKELYNGVFKK